MNRTQRIILYILLLIAGASWIVISGQPTGTTTVAAAAPQAGFTAPDFTLKTAEGETYTLSELKGQAVLINVWATWCPPCKAEMPAIEKMYNEYKGQGFNVLAINSTFQDDPLQIKPFTEEYSLTFPILLDETSDISRDYQVRSLPSSYFVNRYGIITEVVIGGPMSEALLRTKIEEALKP
ncbi:MAG TPA: TlpA disulfide reductase family protein [Anaerolineales bacterium]|nr:TlpA disulfide reductase family protein [Anaerolineales bacterium]HNM36259.1 TlpA disulfide reductase family protein [Anaerolineales bacterium]